MARCPIARVVRVIDGVRDNIEEHEATCRDRVVGVAVHPRDHEELQIVEVWGLPVLAWDEVAAGRYSLLCEANGILTPDLKTFEELEELWKFGLPPPAL